MGAFTFNIISGQPPFTASLSRIGDPPYIKTELDLGYNYFAGVAQGNNYTLTVSDDLGCSFTIYNIDLEFLVCSDTGIFEYAHSSIVVNNDIFLGERKADPCVIKFSDPEDLSVYSTACITGVGSAGAGLESVCYSSSTGKLYFGARDNISGNLCIVEVDPTTLAHVEHVMSLPTPILAGFFVITTDGTYIYGGNEIEFFKIRIADWSVIQTGSYIPIIAGIPVDSGFRNAHGIAINPARDEFYVSAQAISKVAIVSMTDVTSYTIVDISSCVSHPTDDMCFYDDGSTCKVYVAGEFSFLGKGACSIETTAGNTVECIELSRSYGLWNYCTKIYSAGIDEKIEVFDVSDPTVVKTYTFDEVGFVPNEIMFVGEKLYATKWAGLGSAKLCYYCMDVDCTTTTTSTTCYIEYEILEVGCGDTTTTTTTSIDIGDAFIFEITVGAETVTLPLHEKFDDTAIYGDGTDADYDFTVYWDFENDTSINDYVDAYDSPNASHTYAPGTYVVVIKGTCNTFAMRTRFGSSTKSIASKITKVYRWGTSADFRSLDFYECTSLTDLPHDFLVNPYGYSDGTITGAANIKTFAYFLYSCSGYTYTINENLFSACPDVTSFYYSFAYSGVTGVVPDSLFSSNELALIFTYTFSNTAITGINPVTLFADNEDATNFDGTFYYCTGLTSGVLTTDLFRWNVDVVTFNRCFMFCKNINDNLPSNFFYYNEAVLDFGWCFSNCWSIPGTIPADLFATNSGNDRICTSMQGLFWISGSGCYSTLEGEIPADLFANCTAVYDFYGTFRWQYGRFLGGSWHYGLSNAPQGLFRNNLAVHPITGVQTFQQTFEACNNMMLDPFVFSEDTLESTQARFSGIKAVFIRCFEFGTGGYRNAPHGRCAPEIWDDIKYPATTKTGTGCYGGVYADIAYANYECIPASYGGTGYDAGACALLDPCAEYATTTSSTTTP